ncbi:MAG: hypothetical protein Q4C52_04785 [Eubacteriales bacterium]|nr:hypothetical protein [Eubacteriales bacterium]
MTLKDTERFDKIFNSGKYFHDVSDSDFLRSACECEKLYDYMQSEGVPIYEELDIKKYMHFAYWLGAINEKECALAAMKKGDIYE